MKTRRLGRTGVAVSEIGYGAWGIGGSQWMGARDDESLKALHRAVDLGLNFIDTALAYGDGHSEQLVGRLVRERQETIHVATKVPPGNMEWPAAKPAAEVFPAAHIRKSAETSLRNLGLERINGADHRRERGACAPHLVDELDSLGRKKFTISFATHIGRSSWSEWPVCASNRNHPGVFFMSRAVCFVHEARSPPTSSSPAMSNVRVRL